MTLVNVDPWVVLDQKTHVSVLFFLEPGQLHFQRPDQSNNVSSWQVHVSMTFYDIPNESFWEKVTWLTTSCISAPKMLCTKIPLEVVAYLQEYVFRNRYISKRANAHLHDQEFLTLELSYHICHEATVGKKESKIKCFVLSMHAACIYLILNPNWQTINSSNWTRHQI